MRQLTYVCPGRVEWREVPEPRLENPQDALLRPIAASRCDLDCTYLLKNFPRMFRTGKWLGKLSHYFCGLVGEGLFQGPFPIGHECVGEIVALGDQVETLKIGQKVAVPFKISCGSCAACRRGQTGACETYDPFDILSGLGLNGRWGGAMSDLLRIPHAETMLVPLGEGIDPVQVASISDNIPDAWRGVGPFLQQNPEQSVLVIGGVARSIGLYAAALAVALGSPQVDYLDHNAGRLALAEKAGAQPKEGSKKKFQGRYDLIVDASSSQEGLDCALRCLAPHGTLTLNGLYFQKKVTVPFAETYMKGANLRMGMPDALASIPEILELVRSGRFKPELVTTRLAAWDEAPEAITDPSEKVVLRR